MLYVSGQAPIVTPPLNSRSPLTLKFVFSIKSCKAFCTSTLVEIQLATQTQSSHEEISTCKTPHHPSVATTHDQTKFIQVIDDSTREPSSLHSIADQRIGARSTVRSGQETISNVRTVHARFIACVKLSDIHEKSGERSTL